jgi:acyl carrier protein
MTKEKIYAMFVEVLAEHFEIEGEQVHAQARLDADLDLDSLDLIALGAEIEAKSGFVIDEKDVRGCVTLGDLIDRFAASATERAS